jgi:hypothetical protein
MRRARRHIEPIGWREFHPAKFCSTDGVALLSVMRGESLIGMPVVEYAGRDIEDLLMILAEMSIRSLTRLRWSMSRETFAINCAGNGPANGVNFGRSSRDASSHRGYPTVTK